VDVLAVLVGLAFSLDSFKGFFVSPSVARLRSRMTPCRDRSAVSEWLQG
jgi:hypothetical protein